MLREVVWLTQVHGRAVLDVPPPDRDAGPVAPVARHAGEGDALVATDPASAVAVLTADCAPVALGSPEGVFAAVHVGWRGLLAGVVEAAVGRMRELGALEVVGALGPCIHADCYEFDGVGLDQLVAVFGAGVRSRTRTGRPALDLPAAVAAALDATGAAQIPADGACTGCASGYYSHRARGDHGRQAMVVWADGDDPGR